MWSSESNDYAIRESGSRIKVHKNFAEKHTLKIEYTVEGMHGGALVGEAVRLVQALTRTTALGADCYGG